EGGLSKRSRAGASASSSDSTSARTRSPGGQALSRKERRADSGRSTAWLNRVSMRSQSAGVMRLWPWIGSAFVGHFANQPGTREPPIAIHGDDGDSENFGRFLDAEAAEVAQLNHAALAGIDGMERFERLVQSHHFGRFLRHDRLGILRHELNTS